jgi:CheY-like chemotaxis protein
MKILLFNPGINAEHAIARALHSRGVGILFPATVDEAWQMLALHGTSIDLAVVHREGSGANLAENEPGMKLIARAKADASHADLPVILTSGIWGEREFARHQQSALGVNAYLSSPFKEAQLIQMIEAVLGQPVGADATGTLRVSRPTAEVPTAGAPVLEDATSLYQEAPRKSSGIQLESPSIPTAGGSSIPALAAPPPPRATSAPREVSAPAPSASTSASIPTAVPTLSLLPEPQQADPYAGGGIEMSIESTGSLDIEHTRVAGADDVQEASLAEPSAFGVQDPTQPSLDASAMPPLEQPTAQATGRAHGHKAGTLDLTDGGQPLEAPESPSFDEDEQAKQDLPYLYGNRDRTDSRALAPEIDFKTNPAMLLGQPLGDSVVPGGAAQAPDTETLKKYLLLREQDVAVLSSQLRTTQEQVKHLESNLREERGRAAHLTHVNHEQAQKIGDFEKNQSVTVESLQNEINDLRFELKSRSDRARALEAQVRGSTEEIERLKERVRLDIRKIRVREKDLENKLEIARKDSEALIAARENKIMELKRKLDLIEFNLDLIQNQYAKEKEVSATLRERLIKAAQVVRVAGGLLDQPGQPSNASPSAVRSAKNSPSSPEASGELELQEATNQEAS